jgi:hypothetical protein
MPSVNFGYIVAMVLITVAISFMLYICGYLIMECMNHPIKLGITQDAIIHPDVVIDIENVIFSDMD